MLQFIFRFYQGLYCGPSDPKGDDIPMCHHASNFLSKDKERSKRIDGKEKIENFVKVKIVVEWSVCEAADKKLNDPMKEI